MNITAIDTVNFSSGTNKDFIPHMVFNSVPGFRSLESYGFPNYAVNKDGIVINTYTGEIVPIYSQTNTGGGVVRLVYNFFTQTYPIAKLVGEMFWDLPEEEHNGVYGPVISNYSIWNMLGPNEKWDLRLLFPLFNFQEYWIDKQQRLWSLVSPVIKILLPNHDDGGYRDYRLNTTDNTRKHIRSDRIICTIYHPEVPEDMKARHATTETLSVRHLNGDKSDDTPSNLCWTEDSDVKNPINSDITKIMGEELNFLDEQTIRNICTALKEGKTPKEIANTLGMKLGIVKCIQKGKVRMEIVQEYLPFPELTEE